MTISLLMMIVAVAGFLAVTVISNYVCRGQLSKMAGMTIAMSVAMLFGLLSGIALGVYFQENLFLSTILSMGIALFAGYLVAFPFGTLAVLEGVMAALMGGMMGAMLGVMVIGFQADILIKIIFTFYIVMNTIILMYIWKHKIEGIPLFKNPMFSFVTLFSFFYFFHQLGPVMQVNDQQNSPYRSAEHSTQSSKTLTITAEEYRYTPEKIVVKKGEAVNIQLMNKGQVEHDIEFLNKEGVKVENAQMHQHSRQGTIHLHAMPGRENAISMVFEKSGEYRFVCTLPKHQELGMEGKILVES